MKVRCVFTGQSRIGEPLRPTSTEKWDRLKSWIAEADVRFTNLEHTVPDKRPCWPMGDSEDVPSAGTAVIDELEKIGFNLFSLANNHAWAAGVDGILDTLEQMEQRSLAHAGTGRNLDEAQGAGYIRKNNHTIGLIAMAGGCLPPQAFASNLGRRGRPGVNPLRIRPYHQLPGNDFDMLRGIAQRFNSIKVKGPGPERFNKVNVVRDTFGATIAAESAVEEEEQALEFVGQRFVRGDDCGIFRRIQPSDKERHLANIRKTAEQADIVLVYAHHHHWEPDRFKVGPWFQEFARECIDAGAHTFIGAGLPILQPIEVHRGMPIIYSQGNFIFHTATAEAWSNPWVWQSVILSGEFEGGRWRSLTATPITLAEPAVLESGDFSRSSRHCPMAATNGQAERILERLKSISEPYGTHIELQESCATILIR
ncbi:MAG: CapA family protein [Chloroflexi bacterium]|nr:CapA family protein [Chloroflexota bacterium]